MYSTGWKKFEPAWDVVIRVKQVIADAALLEAILSPASLPRTRCRREEQRAGGRRHFSRGATIFVMRPTLVSPAYRLSPCPSPSSWLR